MARPLRIEYEGAVYHVTARGSERGKIFFSKRDYEKFKEYLAEAQEKHGFILHSYVLMTNHYHLLLETPEKNLSRIMHHINSSYTTYTNIKRKRSGHLFQGRYKAIIVDKDNYLLELSRYLHLNPVRANMTQRPEEYAYSSYRSFIFNTGESLVTTNTILGMVANSTNDAMDCYRSFVESALGEELDSPVGKVYGGIVLGCDVFIKEVLNRLEEGRLTSEEISNRKALRATMGTEEIVTSLCEQFGISRTEITGNKESAARNAGIYLMKKYSGASNKDIGGLFGGMSYSAVTKAFQRFRKQLEEDKGLRRQIKGLEMKMSTFKA
jgi:REP element-mobilizing transposase RayT